MSKASSDDDTTSIPPSEPGDEEEPEANLADMKRAMETKITCEKTGKKRSLWSVSMETYGMARGTDSANDLWLETVDQGLPMLKNYLKEKDTKLAEEQEQAKMKLPFDSWMDLVPLDEFHTNQTNFLKAFLKWAIKDKEDIVEGSEDANLVVNASKARRRLDMYLDWMKDNMAADLAEHPLTYESVKETSKVWGMDGSVATDGHFIWWLDISKLDKKKIKTISAQDNLRYMVWYIHLVMFDKKAQDNGVLILQDLNKIGFWSSMTLVPMDLGAKMDRLTIGTVPVKMKGVFLFGGARWLSIMMGMMKPFMSKKMRDRVITVTGSLAPDKQKYLDDLVGRDSIPDGFLGLQGGLPPNAMMTRLKKKEKKKEKKAAKKSKEEGDK
mmetsp:Transcript_17672/g.38610  ORF Transcript_17672/g.38610 Transcript_17672/m.38610 type:complete len:383 (+) Transcript_17672:123-1271(+)